MEQAEVNAPAAAADILEELGALAAASRETAASPAAPPASTALDEEYRQLLAAMGDAPVSIDLLADRCGLTAEALSSMLLILELEGYVAAIPGGLYGRQKI